MDEFLPYLTNDYSTGLYSESTNDIYHSAYGALSEAYEKFINPLCLPDAFKTSKNINVLDICYGIGYNTKAFLNEFIKYYSKQSCKNIYNIKIDCVDTNKNLMMLSPFINSYINFYNRLFCKKELYKNILNYNQAKKIIKQKKIQQIKDYKINPVVNMLLVENLIKNFSKDFFSCLDKKYALENEKNIFLDDCMLFFYQFLSKKEVLSFKNKNKSTFVHNIYYENVLKRYKKQLELISINNITINFNPYDVRNFITSTDSLYDIVFLDGFTPSKCPCIWTYELVGALFEHLNTNGLVVTYNMSAPVRNALKCAGFYIGDTVDKNNKSIGTIAAKNKKSIKHYISPKYLGLLKTKAGITYKDETLSMNNQKIIENRTEEFNNSQLETATSYLKRYNNEI